MSELSPVSTRRPVPDHMFGGRLKGSYVLDLEVVGVDEIAPRVRLITMASLDDPPADVPAHIETPPKCEPLLIPPTRTVLLSPGAAMMVSG